MGGGGECQDDKERGVLGIRRKQVCLGVGQERLHRLRSRAIPYPDAADANPSSSSYPSSQSSSVVLGGEHAPLGYRPCALEASEH